MQLTTFQKFRGLILALLAAGAVVAMGGNFMAQDFRKGMVRGKVVDPAGKPVADATVALQDAKGKVLGWAKTDGAGEYRISADPKVALNMKPSHSRGLLEECVRAASGAAMEIVRVASGTVVNPGSTVRSGIVAVASGSSKQEVVQAAAAGVPTPGTVTGQAGKEAGGTLANAALGGAPKPQAPPVNIHGQALLMVSAPGFKEASVADPAYWMDPPTGEKQDAVGVQVSMQTIKLAPTEGDKKPEIVPEAVTLSDLDVQPALIPAGADMQIKVKLNSPDPAIGSKVRIFARLASKNTVVELLPVAGQAGIYSGKMTVDAKTAAGATILSVGALRTEPVEVRLNTKKADPLIAFASRTEDMNGSKPYGYDPFVMASENRLDANVTILAAKG